MRAHRLVLLATWVVVSLLAVAGFAAFATPSPETAPSDEYSPTTEIGRGAGAVAALTFSYLAEGKPVPASTIDLDAAIQAAVEHRASSAGTTTTEAEKRRSDTTSPYRRSRYLSEIEIRELVSRYFRPEDVNKAIRIAWCESSFNPYSVNPQTQASGLFQHLPRYWEERSAAAGFAGADIFDPEANVAVAAWLVYEGGGWTHWTCRA